MKNSKQYFTLLAERRTLCQRHREKVKEYNQYKNTNIPMGWHEIEESAQRIIEVQTKLEELTK